MTPLDSATCYRALLPRADARASRCVFFASAAEAAALPWRPWRSYAVMHLWRALAQGG